MQEYTVEELLKAREMRVGFINELLVKYQNPLLVVRVNYPGLGKTNPMTVKIIEEMSQFISTLLEEKICAMVQGQGAEGPVLYVAVKEDAVALKFSTMDIEEKHLLGRCLDIDVYNLEGLNISRQDLGFTRRKCYLCEDDAHLCVRSRRHSEYEVVAYIEGRFRDYMEKRMV